MMKVVDKYVKDLGWKKSTIENEVSLEQLAAALNKMRKIVFDLNCAEIFIIVEGYIQHFQAPVLNQPES